MLRRLFLIVACVVLPPLLAVGFYDLTQYYLATSHKFLDPKIQEYAFYGEIAFFYVAAMMELRSRWSPAD